MLSTELRFSIHSVRVYEKVRLARCLRVQGLVTFNDMDNNGQVIVNLETLTRRIKCEHLNITVKDWALENTSTSLGAVLIVSCLLSLFASVAIILLAVFIFMETKSYFAGKGKKDLPMREYWRLINFWEIAVLISDILTIYGTIWIVFENEHSEWIVETLDSYTVWLGFGCLFAWISLLRFFKFHNKFHLLFRTLFKAFGNVLAYLLCVTVLFIGFWMCGFVVLSPYHVKFRTPETAAETLFSMVNGDEIFTTLAMLETNKIGGKWVWWFSRVYFGAYIAIFTIVVINLLIAIYMSAYESIRNYYKNGPEERDLGPMGKAWRKYLSEKRPNEHNPISKSICTFLTALTDDKRQFSKGEESLRDEMKRLVRVESNKPILIKPRTLRAFMNEEEDTPTVINCGCFNINFLTFFNKEKITYEPFKNCKMLTKQKT
ncbi:mucolipin-3-like [Ruditapes philippinarum]|uniref:mucolipin-3-like n=1 Tax=Ruditapes philippinarum TaxID=129788 RepID=UPI00295BCECA|nr:mucolipin-3-like [Ruditapes philippinarum]